MQSEQPKPEHSQTNPTLLRRLAALVANTPLHPQWFSFFRENRALEQTCAKLEGLVVDIGCADGKPRAHLPAGAHYIGIDYYSTAMEWYDTRPELFADAQALPLTDNSVDHSLLLDVLEHIPDPDCCLAEIYRALKPGGSLTIQVPFLYPVHDAPLDFHRWTHFGLVAAAQKQGFRIANETAVGHPLETAALNLNIASSKTILNWLSQKNPLALLGLALPVFVLATNCLAWLLAALSPSDGLMPYGYRMVWIKQ